METGEDPDDSEQGRERQEPGNAGGPPGHRRTPLTPDFELREIRKGSKPGSRYVRFAPRRERPFERVEEGEYRATEAAVRPRSGAEALWQGFKRILVGPPLATSQLMGERLSKLKALAIFSSNNLSSSAYATEEILLVLVLASTGAFVWSLPIALAIAGLVVIVAISYSQVIRGYPNGGGSYVVAKDNLGEVPGIVAGASLVVDYTLTVAVSTAAGVAAITSAVPELHDERVPLAIGLVAALTLANLRGLRESGTLFSIPTYFFIASFTVLIVTGLARIAMGQDLSAGTPPDVVEEGTKASGLALVWIIMRAFSSGSAALTGIEAISNGVPSFKPPEARNANVTLAWMAVILSFFFLGLTVLAREIDVMPSTSRTVVAQVAEGVFGETPLFYVVQIATTLILILAANTSFVGLPALASVMARDRVLPKRFSFRGDRLAFSNGIIVLGLASVGLLILFQADTHSLIPLYAVGVFIGFTLSQAGLALRWHREGGPGANRSLVINAVGAAVTGVVAVIITVAKFGDGAWITLAAIAALSFIFIQTLRYYRGIAEKLEVRERAVPPEAHQPNRAVVVPVDELNRAVLHTLNYACAISENVTAVHVTDDMETAEPFREEWEAKIPETPIVIIESPNRSLIAPLLSYIDALDRADPNAPVTIVLPEFVPAHFWEGLLHNQTALQLKKALIHRPNTIIIDVPYHLRS